MHPQTAALARGLLLVSIALAVYRPVFDAGFLHDDDELLTANPIVQRGGRSFGPEAWAGLRELWVPDPGSLTAFHMPGIPVTASLLWLEWRLFGSDDARAAPEARGIGAPGYHVVNVLLHALCALLFWRVLLQLALPGAWFAALLLAVHPVGVESVAWIAEEKNTLAMLFALASTLAWLRWSDTRERAAWALALFAFLLALLAKPAVAPFPLVLLSIGWWRRRPLRAELLAALPFFGLALVAGLVAIAAQANLAIGGEEIPVGSPLERALHASYALGFYAWKALYPFDLVAIYPRWHETLPWAIQLAPALVLAGLLAAAWRARERWGRHAIPCAVGFTLMLALGLVPMSYLRHTLVADHFAYFALPFPIALFVGGAAAWLARQRATPIALARAAAAALALLLAWQTTGHAATFHDKHTLWTHTIARNPGAWLAHDQLGLLLAAEGRFALALPYFERAVELAPQISELHNNLAVAFDHLGQRDQALAQIQEAARLRPDDYFVRVNSATGLLDAGRVREALPHFEAALALAPRLRIAADPAIRVAYASALLQADRPRAAIAQLEHALALAPALPAAHRLLAIAQHQLVEARSVPRNDAN
jgi:tetratricopeptide (TPR) repeat protein